MLKPVRLDVTGSARSKELRAANGAKPCAIEDLFPL